MPPQKVADPDGVRRCFNCSTSPATIARREANKLHGRAAGEKQRGVKRDQRGAVMAGVIPIERARAEKSESDAKAARTVDPIPLDSKEAVFSFLARVSADLMDEKPNGWASAAASLAGVALKAMGVEVDLAGEEENEEPRKFKYATTTGAVLAMRGRE